MSAFFTTCWSLIVCHKVPSAPKHSRGHVDLFNKIILKDQFWGGIISCFVSVQLIFQSSTFWAYSCSVLQAHYCSLVVRCRGNIAKPRRRLSAQNQQHSSCSPRFRKTFAPSAHFTL